MPAQMRVGARMMQTRSSLKPGSDQGLECIRTRPMYPTPINHTGHEI
jgi:hypothetical protein